MIGLLLFLCDRNVSYIITNDDIDFELRRSNRNDDIILLQLGNNHRNDAAILQAAIPHTARLQECSIDNDLNSLDNDIKWILCVGIGNLLVLVLICFFCVIYCFLNNEL